MPIELDATSPSITYGVVGFFLVGVSLISYVVKNKLFLSGAILSLLTGIIVGPYVLDWVDPFTKWSGGNELLFEQITFEIMRVVIAVQVLFAGISLPKAYLRRSWRSLTILILPVMTLAWLVSGLLIWGLLPGLSFIEALVIGACIAPTDPILAAAIVKGRFAQEHVPKAVRNLLSAESGANDGLGFPFLYFAIYLIDRPTHDWSLGYALSEWILTTWLYQVILGVVAGFVIGFVARKTLKFAEQKRLIDNESIFAYGIGLALFCCGTVGLLGSDDLLCAFIAGNSLTWDDWYRLVSEDESFQATIDELLDTTVLIYVGTILPFASFNDGGSQQQIWRFLVLALLVLLFRRLPWVLLTHKSIPDIQGWKEAVFVGHMGPIGVSAIYYVQVALMRLPEDRTRLRQLLSPVVLFMVLASVLIHGISVPVARLSRHTYTRTRSLRASGASTPKQAAPLAGTLPLPVPPPGPVTTGATHEGDSTPKTAQGVHFISHDVSTTPNDSSIVMH